MDGYRSLFGSWKKINSHKEYCKFLCIEFISLLCIRSGHLYGGSKNYHWKMCKWPDHLASCVEGKVKLNNMEWHFYFDFPWLQISISIPFVVCSFPFDRHSIPGYFYYSFIGGVCVYIFLGSVFVHGQFFIGICFYLKAFCQDFTNSIQKHIDELHDNLVKKTAASRDLIAFENALNKELCAAIDFQADIIEWVSFVRFYFHQETTHFHNFIVSNEICSFYGRMEEILNGIMFSNLAGGAIFCAIAVVQVVQVVQVEAVKI